MGNGTPTLLSLLLARIQRRSDSVQANSEDESCAVLVKNMHYVPYRVSRGQSQSINLLALLSLIALTFLLIPRRLGSQTLGDQTTVGGVSVSPFALGQVRDMKVIAPQVGWVLLQQRLYWTTSDGQEWNDITPPNNTAGQIDAVFFLDRLNGWALLSGPSSTDAAGFFLTLASTIDTGKTWVKHPIDTSIDSHFNIYGGGGAIFFLDALHGWLTLRLMSSSNFSIGLLLVTQDGGRTWTKLADPPVAEPVYFVNLTNGWMAGGPSGQGLWQTLDGGRSWLQRVIDTPSPCPRCRVEYNLPKFQNEREGIVPLTILTINGALVGAYTTLDAGKSWQLGEVHSSPAHNIALSVVDNQLFRVSASSMGRVNIEDPVGIRQAILPPTLFPLGSIVKSSWADKLSGWLVYCKRLELAVLTGDR